MFYILFSESRKSDLEFLMNFLVDILIEIKRKIVAFAKFSDATLSKIYNVSSFQVIYAATYQRRIVHTLVKNEALAD